MNMSEFLPQDYEPPRTAGNYMKLQSGENKIRILSAPIIGWEDWTLEGKPIRFAFEKKPENPINLERPIKHFWAMLVWNYNEQKIQILQLTQASIRNAIKSFYENEDWGAPFFYDVKIFKKGEKMKTEYTVIPSPKKELSEEVRKAMKAKPCDLSALFRGEDPFEIKEVIIKDVTLKNGMDFAVSSTKNDNASDPFLSEDQVKEIQSLVGNDIGLLSRILIGYEAENLSQIKQSKFVAITGKLKKRIS